MCCFAAVVLEVYVVDVCDFAYIWIMIRCTVITLSYCIWLVSGLGLLLGFVVGFLGGFLLLSVVWIVYLVVDYLLCCLGFGVLLVIHILISLDYSGLLLWLLYGLVLLGFVGFRVWALSFVLWCLNWLVVFSRVVVYCIILYYIILLLFSYFGWFASGWVLVDGFLAGFSGFSRLCFVVFLCFAFGSARIGVDII